jgi:RNA polymerase sigma-70 factor (ECF subfamily)
MTNSTELAEPVLRHPLADEVRAAEAAAFEEELAPLLLPAHRLAVGMLLDRELAEDAVQEAALRAWDRRRNRRPDTQLGPWFLGIVVNRCRESRRSRWARVLRLAEPRGNAVSRPEENAASRMDMRRALRGLPEKARLAVVLRYYLDLPSSEMAELLGCSENAAKVRVSRAVAALRAALNVPEVPR